MFRDLVDFPKKGKYLIAVSGGVDSVSLLDILAKTNNYDLIIAHFDHGIRPDSQQDLQFVRQLAANYGLKFVSETQALGSGASEETARYYRWSFFQQSLIDNKLATLITAHHQDDLIETALINLIRGTGRKGLNSLSQTNTIKRPFLKIQKSMIIKYAKDNNLQWHEDSTNQDIKYLRNYLRHKIIPKLELDQRLKLVSLIHNQEKLNIKIDNLLSKLFRDNQQIIELELLRSLDHQLSTELIAQWLRLNGLNKFSQKQINDLVIRAKLKKPGTRLSIYGSYQVIIQKNSLELI